MKRKATKNQNQKTEAPSAAPQSQSVIDLASKSMLVYVGTSKMGATKKDSGATDAAIAAFDAATDAGAFSKRLFPKKTPAIQAVESAFNKALTIYEQETLPWFDGGGRLLLAVNYLRFADLIRGAKAEIERAVSDLALVYDDLVGAQASRLGRMFNATEYPKAEELKDIYALTVQVYPVPTANDFRVQLMDDSVEAIKAQIDANARRCFEEAMLEIYGRLWDQTSHMVKILNSPDPKRSIKDVLVENVRAAVEAIPRVNLTDDQNLIQKGNQIMAELCAITGAQLRTNDTLRASVAAKAAEITADLAKALGIEETPEPQPEAPEPNNKAAQPPAPAAPRKTKRQRKPKQVEPVVAPPSALVSVDQVDQIASDMSAIFG